MATLVTRIRNPAFRRGFQQGMSGVMMFSRGTDLVHYGKIDASIKRAWTNVGNALKVGEQIERSKFVKAPAKANT